MRRRLLLALGLIAALPSIARADVQTSDKALFDRKIAEATEAMQVKPLEAARLAHEAESLANSSPTMLRRSVAVAEAMWLQGEAAMRVNNSDVGGPLIRRALAIARRDAAGSKLHGDLLLSFSRLQAQNGHPEEALTASQGAFEIFRRLDLPRSQAVALQSIGSIYQFADDFEKVLYYYNLADETAPGDLSLGLSSSNNRANAFRELGRFPEAVREYRRALGITRKLGSPVLVSRVLANLALAQVLAGDLKGARASTVSGLAIASRPETSGWHAALLATAASIALEDKKYSDSVRLAEQAFAEIGGEQRSQPHRSLQGVAYRAYKALGNYRNALEHFEIFIELEKQSRAAAASTSAKLLSARFDFANQNSRIATLRSEKLARDIELTRLNARQQAMALTALLALATIAILFLFIYLRSMRISRNKLQASNDALRLSNVDLEKALVAKSLFLATTSHEIRTPLNGVLGMAQVILADRAIAGRLRDQIQLIEGAGNTMKALVDDILDLAKMDSGEYEVISAPVDPAALLTEVVAFWRTQARRKDLEISLDCAGLSGQIYSDPTRLRQVLFNLVSNAIKFTTTGSVSVVARVVPGTGGETLHIDIIDTGIGIPSESFEAIFDKFHQLDQTTSRQFSGSGLGLAISRHIVRALGGDIVVASEVGKGSTFGVRLPLRRVATAAAEVIADREPATTLAMSRVLVAAASPITASILCASLKPHVAATASCADPGAIVAHVESADIDLVLLDGDALRVAGIDPVAFADGLVLALARLNASLVMLLTPPVDLAARVNIVARPVAANALVDILDSVFPSNRRNLDTPHAATG